MASNLRLLALLLALFSLLQGGWAKQSLRVAASGPAASEDVNSLEVLVSFTNTGDESLRLFNDPETPLSSEWATSESFNVDSADGKVPDFVGVHVLTAPEVLSQEAVREKNTVVLAPGQSVNVSHFIGESFDFTNTGAGEYTITPASVYKLVADDGSMTDLRAEVESHQISLTGTLGPATSPPFRPGNRRHGLSKRTTFTSCSNSQISTLQTAMKRATEQANAAIKHLQDNPNGSELQTTWFGTFSTSRYNKVLGGYKKLAPDMATIFSYDCSCESDVIVATIGGTYGDVKICSVYFNEAVVPPEFEGVRSQWGTVIHESTHFGAVLRTIDHGYGVDACKALALQNPDTAVGNADNYPMFASFV